MSTTDAEIAEIIYDSLRRTSSDRNVISVTIERLLKHRTDDQRFQSVVVAMAMLHANTKGH
jgi:hypothetical protein